MSYVLFAAQDTVQESLGFSPAALVYGHPMCGPLKMFKKNISPKVNILDHLHHAHTLLKQTLQGAQGRIKKGFDHGAVAWPFKVNDQGLVLLPLFARFSGPYPVLKRLSETDCIIGTPDRCHKTRVCHVNMLKPYVTRSSDAQASIEAVSNITMQCSAVVASLAEPADSDAQCPNPIIQQNPHLANSEMLKTLREHLHYLKLVQQNEIVWLELSSLFNDVTSRTTVIQSISTIFLFV